MSFKDHFSGHAAAYAAHRPSYSPALVDALAGHCEMRRLALDCGCGSGQLAVLLAQNFDRVCAVDASSAQISSAMPHSRVEYCIAPAEHTGTADHSVDLVVAAQAAHWFDIEAFWAEVRRVAAPGGVCALVSYGVTQVEPSIDDLIGHFHDVSLAGFWPPERMSVVHGYRDIHFPFAEISTPPLEMTCQWTCTEFLDYVDTWSGVKAAQRAGSGFLVSRFREDLFKLWGASDLRRDIRWPLTVRLGRVSFRSKSQ